MVSVYELFSLLLGILSMISSLLIGSLFIYKSRKFEIKILLFAGLSIFFWGFGFIFGIYNLLSILFTGVDIISTEIFFSFLNVVFQIVYSLCTIYVGGKLLFPKKIRLFFSIILLGVAIQATIGFTYMIIDPMVFESIVDFVTEGIFSTSNLGWVNYLMMGVSLITIFIFMVIGFLVKSIQYRGKLRIKFFILLLSYSVLVITEVTGLFQKASPRILIISGSLNYRISILIGILDLFYLLLYYYGLKPSKSIKHKKVLSQEEIRLTSYMLGKPIPAEIAEEELKQEISRIQVEKKIKKPILIFMSYATKDAEYFNVSEISEGLTVYDEIKDVLYWQEDLHDNIIEYMNENLKKCDVMILFCSENALKSVPVKKEWTAADIMGMPIIPVFTEPNYIPPILKSRLGYEFNPDDIQTNVQELYDLALKKWEAYYE
ncbi:MAG: toll/interleukin-1 receptor domain-containing protein, partial [Promethearchaeota archaeon]